MTQSSISFSGFRANGKAENETLWNIIRNIFGWQRRRPNALRRKVAASNHRWRRGGGRRRIRGVCGLNSKENCVIYQRDVYEWTSVCQFDYQWKSNNIRNLNKQYIFLLAYLISEDFNFRNESDWCCKWRCSNGKSNTKVIRRIQFCCFCFCDFGVDFLKYKS